MTWKKCIWMNSSCFVAIDYLVTIGSWAELCVHSVDGRTMIYQMTNHLGYLYKHNHAEQVSILSEKPHPTEFIWVTFLFNQFSKIYVVFSSERPT